MVVRSLVFKTAAYATLVFFLAIPPAVFVAGKLFESGRRHEAPAFVGPTLAYVERDLEREWSGRPPSQARLDELGQVFHHRLRFVPWQPGGATPAALRTTDRIVDDTPPYLGETRHWIRLDHAGTPVGAIEVQPGMPFHGQGPGRRPPGPPGPGRFFEPRMAWIWLLLLMLIVVPPLWLWVLRPLRAMVGVAGRLAGGDLDTPVAIDRKDEFGELEGAFEHLRVELRRALEQRERLLSDVSHEIRGPLSRMMIALPLLRQEGASGPITDLFEKEVKAVDELVGEVLALARAGHAAQAAHAHARIDLAEVARELLAERGLTADQGARVVEAALAEAPTDGDPRLIRRAIGNLLDNALKYTEPGDRIRLVTAVEGGWAMARVEDEGPGIAAEHLPMIFEPFYRPDTSRSRETGGVGLGLSIVKRVADAHRGTIAVRSPAAGGTVAELKLPLAPAA